MKLATDDRGLCHSIALAASPVHHVTLLQVTRHHKSDAASSSRWLRSSRKEIEPCNSAKQKGGTDGVPAENLGPVT